MPLKQSHSIFLNPITSEEIELEIIKLKSSKATGPFSVPVNILKLMKGIICKPLEILFNSSLLTGVFPNCFKIARVIPLHKKGSTMHYNNYRPISLLPIFSKILEKLVFNRLKNIVFYITSNSVFVQNTLHYMQYYRLQMRYKQLLKMVITRVESSWTYLRPSTQLIIPFYKN